MSERRQLPNSESALSKQGRLSIGWFRFMSSTHAGIPPAEEGPVTLTTSPFTYTAARKGSVIVQGGTVSMLQWARTTANYNIGATAGMFHLAAGDSLIITYTGAPTVTFAPF
jgi:hypothetical protein